MALSYYTNWPENIAAAGFRAPSPPLEMFSFHEEPPFYNTGITQILDENSGEFNRSDLLTPAGDFFIRSPEFQDSSFTFQDSSFTYQDSYYSLPYQGEMFPVEYQYQYTPVAVAETGSYGGGCVGLPPWYGGGGGNVKGGVMGYKKGHGGGSLSAQSMAARVRRRKISEKTQELGKLIPGGDKMNTAEMFQAGFKYIKFLQAQIGVLKLMPSLPETEEVLRNGEMQALVTCTLMQQKLYMAEKCIGPNTLAMEKPSK